MKYLTGSVYLNDVINCKNIAKPSAGKVLLIIIN